MAVLLLLRLRLDVTFFILAFHPGVVFPSPHERFPEPAGSLGPISFCSLLVRARPHLTGFGLRPPTARPAFSASCMRPYFPLNEVQSGKGGC